MATLRSGLGSTVTRVANGSIHRTPTAPVAVANGDQSRISRKNVTMFRILISPRVWLAVLIMLSGIAIMGPLAILLALFFVGLAAV